MALEGQCRTCREAFPVAHLYRLDGRLYCGSCRDRRLDAAIPWWQRHPERMRLHRQTYYARNRDRINAERRRRWAERHS